MGAPLNLFVNQLWEDLTQGYLGAFADAKEKLMEPGYIYGSACAELEAVCRPFHLISLASDLDTPQFEAYKTYFNHELSELLDPNHSRYVGDLGDFDPKLNEASNLAFHFFINEPSWDLLTAGNQTAFLIWISNASKCDIQQNNWVLFRGMLGLFHAQKTSSAISSETRTDFKKVLPWIQDSGWVQDGDNAPIDYYTGFVFYPFMLIGTQHGIFSKIENDQVLQGLKRWGKQIELMTDPSGRLPLFGRSLIYRFAFLSPFLLSERLLGVSLISKDVLLAIVQNYDAHNLSNSGLLTLGVFEEKREVAEHYSIRASAYWLARALAPSSLCKSKDQPEVTLNQPDSWGHDIIRGHAQTYLINVNKAFSDSPYFQHIVDSENGMIRLSSYGTFQRLTLRKGRPLWEPVLCDMTPNNLGHNDASPSKITLSFKQRGIFRIGWNQKVISSSMFRLTSLTRTSSLHFRLNQFRFKEHFFLSLRPSMMDIYIQ